MAEDDLEPHVQPLIGDDIVGLQTDLVDTLIFDYGNTLIPYGPDQVRREFEALQRALSERYGECDSERLKTVRHRQMLAPYKNGYIEHDFEAVCRELIVEVFGLSPSRADVEAIMALRHRLFVEVVNLPEEVRPLLDRLRRHYRLGLLSNYPNFKALRESLDRIGISDLFSGIVVSGEVGFVKPHPTPFEALLKQLGDAPERCLFVGDNWLADIQGAKRIGMQAVLTTQYVAYEDFEPYPDDHEPDVRIAHLNELPAVLGIGRP